MQHRPISMPVDSVVPRSEPATASDYDAYFGLDRTGTNLRRWTAQCLLVERELLNDLPAASLSEEARTSMRLGLLIVHRLNASRWAEVESAPAPGADAGDEWAAVRLQAPLGSLEQIAEVCSAAGVWLHVDAAYGGLWRLLPEVRAITPSLVVADSLVVNPHKGLFVSLESSCLYCRNRGALETSFRAVPDYLSMSDDDGGWDPMNRSLQLGRTFGALKLWWVIRSYGLERIAGQFRHALRTARWLERELDAHPSFRRPAASVFPLVTLQHVRDNRELVRRVNATGKAFVSHATLRDGHVTRVSIRNIRTPRSAAEELWSVLLAAAAVFDTTADAQCA
jgi:hypothetical protein